MGKTDFRTLNNDDELFCIPLILKPKFLSGPRRAQTSALFFVVVLPLQGPCRVFKAFIKGLKKVMKKRKLKVKFLRVRASCLFRFLIRFVLTHLVFDGIRVYSLWRNHTAFLCMS